MSTSSSLDLLSGFLEINLQIWFTEYFLFAVFVCRWPVTWNLQAKIYPFCLVHKPWLVFLWPMSYIAVFPAMSCLCYELYFLWARLLNCYIATLLLLWAKSEIAMRYIAMLLCCCFFSLWPEREGELLNLVNNVPKPPPYSPWTVTYFYGTILMVS